ncbi:dihydrolipoamide acetyltransferase family protein [Arthrobacter alpinus]|uniref:dihydrolipoamide acetyltransferase family protein n=1 Tax=Arthrobacter alpinus TaxID=656366 RepID=UPI001EF61E24|nr:dihydrolipoamide acetyltransferase family protein [Arthrobacter alpinus]
MSVQTTGQVFLLPDLGEGLVEAELVTWLVAVGDEVRIDQPIAEVETAKSVVEVPSPFEGTVVTLHGAEGETLEVGKPLITIASAGGDPTEATSTGGASGSGNVLIGYGTSEVGGPGRSRPAVQAAPKMPLVVSPLVRKLAQDHGIALASIHGSGSEGLILRSDVEAAMLEPVTHSRPSQQQQRAGEVSGVVDQRTGLAEVGRTPLTGVKKAAAAAMVRSRREIPEATVWVDVDATALLELRQGLKAQGSAPGVLAFVTRFVVAGLGNFPQLNMALVSGGGQDELVEFDGINVGFATQTERGLVVPVLRNAQGRSARELDGAIRELTDRALGGKAAPAELGGGTFTINNYGVLGVDGSAAIINYPEAAMLGLGRIVDKPWVVDGELCVRKMTELTLAFDHRVCDGAVAAGFLRFVADAIENPASILADL